MNAKWPDNYHMVFHYVLNDTSDATGEVVVRHVSGNKGVSQRSRVTFKPTVNGSDVTSRFVVVAENGSSTQFAMLDGKYDIQFTTDSHKLLLVCMSNLDIKEAWIGNSFITYCLILLAKLDKKIGQLAMKIMPIYRNTFTGHNYRGKLGKVCFRVISDF